MLGVLLLVWLGVVAWTLLDGRSALLEAREATVEAREALAETDVDGAHERLDHAAATFGRAERRLTNPALWPLDRIVPVWTNLENTRVIARSGRTLTGAALEAVDAAAAQPGGLDGLGPSGGRFPVDRIAELAEPLADALETIEGAREALDAAPTYALVRQVADAREEFAEALDAAIGLVRPAADLTGVMPAFLGAEEPRRYFFVAQNPAELRGTGGFMGSFSLMDVDDGRITFTPFQEIWELPTGDLSEIDPPTDAFVTRYRRIGGWAFWPNINFTPDFPSAAVAMERLYTEVMGEEIDGVIATNPQALEALLKLTGPVEAPEVGLISADDVVEVVTRDAYADFDDEAERKEVLGGVAAAAFGGLLEGGVGEEDRGAALDLLAGMARDGHLKVHAAAPEEQAVLERVGVDGALPPADGTAVGVSVNNRAQNKADGFTSREIAYRLELAEDGGGRAELTIGFENDTPVEGLPSRVIGRGERAGRNQFLVDVFCGGDCQLESFDRRLPGTRAVPEEELGYTVFATSARLESGESDELALAWTQDEAWWPDEDGEGGLLVLTAFDQATLLPTTASIEVAMPDGFEVLGSDGGLEEEGGLWRWEGELSTPRAFVIELALPREDEDPPGGWQRVRGWLSSPLVRF